MNRPAMEPLESRTLLSAATLAAGQAQLFDTNTDGANDAVLVNTGTSTIEYVYSSGSAGLDSVLLTANGGKFTTNMFVTQVGDNSAGSDFSMGSTKISVDVRYDGRRYCAIAGASSVVEGAIDQLEIGRGDLLEVQATTGELGKVYVNRGDLKDASSARGIDSLIVEGDILGTVTAMGEIDLISANRLNGGVIDAGFVVVNRAAIDQIVNGSKITVLSLGTLTACSIGGQANVTVVQDIGKIQVGRIVDASITAGGGIGSLIVDVLAGSAYGTDITVGKHVGKFQAQTATGGTNGTLSLSIGAGVDNFTVGRLDGGLAVDGGFAGTFVSINGDVGKMSTGLISGGTADGSGSFAMLIIDIGEYTDGAGNVQPGDVKCLNAAGLVGGVSENGGDAVLTFTIANDLVRAQIGQIVGSGTNRPICDPSVFLNVGHDIVRLVAGQISAGRATGENAYASVNIDAGNDIISLTGGQVDAGFADGNYSTAAVNIHAGRDIKSITADSFSGGQATGEGAVAGLYVTADGDIDFIGASLISGTRARVHIKDPTVHFVAGGDIGLVMAGRITGGTVNSDGVSMAAASVLIQADGTYEDGDGVQHAGDIGKIVAGTIDGGTANGADALSYVKIQAAHDIDKLYADQILGGRASDGGFAYVSILAKHNINDLQAGLISGVTGGSHGCDPAVVIQAYNDIKSFAAEQIIAGFNGNVSILAGLDAEGNVSGELDADGNLLAGSIEHMVVGLISGNGGIVNIAAGGDIEYLKVCRVISGNGEVNIVAGGDITADIGRVQSWSIQGEGTGVEFVAGGAVNDVRNSIRDGYTQEGVGQDVEFPEAPELPEMPE